VSPHQPFFDIVAMSYETRAGTGITITSGGETFETEDQRNWSDASYKTYSRPLRLPYPYRIEPGRPHVQTLHIDLAPPTSGGVKSSRSDASRIGSATSLPLIGTSLPPGALDPAAGTTLAELDLDFTAVENDH
jgi:hypothetical protein